MAPNSQLQRSAENAYVAFALAWVAFFIFDLFITSPTKDTIKERA